MPEALREIGRAPRREEEEKKKQGRGGADRAHVERFSRTEVWAQRGRTAGAAARPRAPRGRVLENRARRERGKREKGPQVRSRRRSPGWGLGPASHEAASTPDLRKGHMARRARRAPRVRKSCGAETLSPGSRIRKTLRSAAYRSRVLKERAGTFSPTPRSIGNQCHRRSSPMSRFDHVSHMPLSPICHAARSCARRGRCKRGGNRPPRLSPRGAQVDPERDTKAAKFRNPAFCTPQRSPGPTPLIVHGVVLGSAVLALADVGLRADSQRRCRIPRCVASHDV